MTSGSAIQMEGKRFFFEEAPRTGESTPGAAAAGVTQGEVARGTLAREEAAGGGADFVGEEFEPAAVRELEIVEGGEVTGDW